MKIGLKLISVIALLAITVRCANLIEPTPKFSASSTAFSATASSAAIAAAAADSTNTVLTVTWTDPKYSVGLKNSKFTVMVGKAGSNFSSFLSKEFINVLSGDLTGKDLNGMALKFGGVIGQPVALELMVLASQDNNNEPKKSAVLPLSVTPFSGFSVVSSPASITPNPAKISENAVTLSWTSGFNGFKGIVTYELQHAKTGSSFAAPTTIAVTGLSKSLTHLEINTIALSYNIAPSVAGDVDFRVKATNELGAITYSSTTKISVTPYVAINSVGIIGDATPGGWVVDTDLYRPDPTGKPSEWTTTIYLVGGKNALFRQDDLWDTKWGVGGKGGADIPIANSGYYKIDLNVATGVYSFTTVDVPALSSVSIIGPAIGGWEDPNDTQLTQDPSNTNIFYGTFNLVVGMLKFRETNNWGKNWGGPKGDGDPANYPSAWGKRDGGNISVTASGSYYVRIDIATGEYAIGPAANATPYNAVGLIGFATTGTNQGWDNDIPFIKNPSNPFKWSKKLNLFDGAGKFRANSTWDVNWGADSFPAGIGTQDGSDIKNVKAGTYQITLNTLTGEFTFAK